MSPENIDPNDETAETDPISDAVNDMIFGTFTHLDYIEKNTKPKTPIVIPPSNNPEVFEKMRKSILGKLDRKSK